jgi:hypothetical protein
VLWPYIQFVCWCYCYVGPVCTRVGGGVVNCSTINWWSIVYLLVHHIVSLFRFYVSSFMGSGLSHILRDLSLVTVLSSEPICRPVPLLSAFVRDSLFVCKPTVTYS